MVFRFWFQIFSLKKRLLLSDKSEFAMTMYTNDYLLSTNFTGEPANWITNELLNQVTS